MVRLLLSGDAQFEWWAPAWVRGLKELGVDVHFFDYCQFLPSGLRGKIESHFMRGPSFRKANTELMRRASQFKPDIILLHNGFPFMDATVHTLARTLCVAGYHHDNPFGRFGNKIYFRVFKNAISSYSLHHVIRQENIYDYERLGVSQVKLLMTYYVPWIHYPRPTQGCNLDVVFIGHAEEDVRIDYVMKVVESGIRLSIFGPSKSWHRYLPQGVVSRLPPIEPIFGDDYTRTITSGKICLAFYSGGNKDSYSYRVFEIPACGGFLLGQRTEVVQSLYDEGKEAEFFGSSDELIEKIRFYLRNDRARERIAMQGHQRCTRSGYDVISRMRQWLKDVNEWRQA